MFRFGILDPLEAVVEEILACAFETALLIAERPASRVRQSSDDCTTFYVLLVKSTIRLSWSYSPSSSWFDKSDRLLC